MLKKINKDELEKWQLELFNKYGQATYISWFDKLRYENGYIITNSNFAKTKLAEEFGEGIKQVFQKLSLSFHGYKVTT